jgi:hypothetical protein
MNLPWRSDPMSMRRKSTAAAVWSAALLVALVIYVLSFGPALYLLNLGYIPAGVDPALGKVYAPVQWLRTVPLVRGPLNSYMRWWDKMAMEGTPKS